MLSDWMIEEANRSASTGHASGNVALNSSTSIDVINTTTNHAIVAPS